MTCVWRGIIKLLGISEINKVLGTHFHDKIAPKKFVKALQNKNIHVNDVKHNGKILTEMEINENFNSIREIDIKKVGDGYYFSGFEPVLFLISHLFGYDIKHIFCEIPIEYAILPAKGKLIFGATKTHFYPIKKDIY